MPTVRLERLRMSEDHSDHQGPLSVERLCRCPGPRMICSHWPDKSNQRMDKHCEICGKYFKAKKSVSSN